MKLTVGIPFGILCILSSSAWVVQPFPDLNPLPPLQRQGLLFTTAGLIALVVSRRKKQSEEMSTQSRLPLAAAGLAFFGLPALVIERTSSDVPETARAALFSMVPIVIVIALAAGNEKHPAEKGARRSLVPALVGLAGLLLLLPFNLSYSTRGNIMLAVVFAVVALVGISSVWLFRLLQSVELWNAAATLCLSNATFLLLSGAATGNLTWNSSVFSSLLSLSSLISLLEIPLLLWLAREMPPYASPPAISSFRC